MVSLTLAGSFRSFAPSIRRIRFGFAPTLLVESRERDGTYHVFGWVAGLSTVTAWPE